MAGLVIEGAESELLASPLAIINSSSEPIDPDVNLKRRKQNQNMRGLARKAGGFGSMSVLNPTLTLTCYQLTAVGLGEE